MNAAADLMLDLQAAFFWTGPLGGRGWNVFGDKLGSGTCIHKQRCIEHDYGAQPSLA